MRRWKWSWIFTMWFLALPLGAIAIAADGDDDEEEEKGLQLKLSGAIQTDIRYTLPKMNPFSCAPSGATWRKGWCHGAFDTKENKSGFSRNENFARTRLSIRSGDYKGVAELDFVWYGIQQQPADLQGVIYREQLDPFRIEAHALYFEVTNFLFKGMDLRVGKQIVTWGRADQFNPTSNINSLDLEDPLLFGDRVSNSMVRLDYNPKGDWIFTFVWVPVFKPFQLPLSAPLALTGVDRIPMADASLRRRLHVERDFAEQFLGLPTVVTKATPVLPETDMTNSQVALKAAGKLAKMDFSLSYYYGRNGLPQPMINRVFGAAGGGAIENQTSLMYPRMHVLGFDWAGQIPFQKGPGARGLGFWFELAVFFPQRVQMPIYQNNVPVLGTGEYDYNADGVPGGTAPTIVEPKPFAKWVLGVDYSFNRSFYVNLQWVHGFVDEFGAGDFFSKGFIPTKGWMDLDTNNDGVPDLDPLLHCGVTSGANGNLCAKEILRPRLGDYLVAGIDFKFYQEKMLLRLFFILDMTGTYIEEFVQTPGGSPTEGKRVRTHRNAFEADGFSMVLFPQWTWSIGHGVEVALGAFWYFGKKTSKFGDPATGGSTVFAKGKFSF